MARQFYFARRWIVPRIVWGMLCHGILLLSPRLMYVWHQFPEALYPVPLPIWSAVPFFVRWRRRNVVSFSGEGAAELCWSINRRRSWLAVCWNVKENDSNTLSLRLIKRQAPTLHYPPPDHRHNEGTAYGDSVCTSWVCDSIEQVYERCAPVIHLRVRICVSEEDDRREYFNPAKTSDKTYWDKSRFRKFYNR